MNRRISFLFFAWLAVLFAVQMRLTAAGLDVWELRNSDTSNHLRGITFSGRLFVAVGDSGTTLTSSNGGTWLVSPGLVTNNLQHIAYGHDHFVAVGESGTILVTSNATDWTVRSLDIDADLHGVVAGDQAFVAVGVKKASPIAVMFRSTNALDWTEVNVSIMNRLQSVTYGAGTFVAPAYYYGDMYYSFDGLTWTVTSGCHNSLLGATYGQGKFIVVGFDSYTPAFPILVSMDGAAWASAKAQDATLFDVVFGGGFFVTVGLTLEGIDPYTLVYSSPDAFSWERRPVRAAGQFLGVTYGLGTFVAVGENGLIMQSGDVTVPRLGIGRAGTNGIPISVFGESGREYTLQASPNPGSPKWIDLATISNAWPSVTYVDHDSTNHAQRFYRLISR